VTIHETTRETTVPPAPVPEAPSAEAADTLVAGLLDEPWGQVTTSVYETGRVTALAPWLTGHAVRLRHLLAAQRPDGGWGDHGEYEYRLVPTLSATDALLAAAGLPAGEGPGGPAAGNGAGAGGAAEGMPERRVLRQAAERGLGWLRHHLAEVAALPDTPAVELIVLSLVERVNERLAGDGAGEPLPLPRGLDPGLLRMLRELAAGGTSLPQKLQHALEVLGPVARDVAGVRPLGPGTVGASPAATAAWLAHADGTAADRDRARRHLAEVAGRFGGPVPVGLPITVFERGWVVSMLARAGIAVTAPEPLVESLAAAAEPGGTPAGPGLPADADTTSVALYALSLLGRPYPPDSLDAYRTSTHFCTWQGEQGFSVTVNAHVLDAYGCYAARRPDAAPRYAATIERLSELLCDRQEADGSWRDRWHTSPYYATACCALALHEYGAGGGRTGDRVTEAVRRAVGWVLGSQREDGSWGRWGGTAEETAYALQILLLTRSRHAAGPEADRARAAVARGHAFLAGAGDGAADPPLWIDKDLYRPVAVVRAAVLSALHLAAGNGARDK